MKQDNLKIFMLSLPASLNKAVRDLTERSKSRNNYKSVLSEIKHFIPVCGDINCRYKIRLYGQNIFVYPPLLHRQSHEFCRVNNCGRNVSYNSHSVCYKHADIYHPVEYFYHHSFCNQKKTK